MCVVVVWGDFVGSSRKEDISQVHGWESDWEDGDGLWMDDLGLDDPSSLVGSFHKDLPPMDLFCGFGGALRDMEYCL